MNLNDIANQKIAAQIFPVAEVSLFARVKNEKIGPLLASQSLAPFGAGMTDMVMVFSEMKYSGMRFGEIAITVAAATRNDPKTEYGSFMLTAFNSNPFFAFVERNIFKAPYRSANIRFSLAERSFHCAMRGKGGSKDSIEVSLSMPESDPAHICHERNVLLPGKTNGVLTFFKARIEGETIHKRSQSDTDSVHVNIGLDRLNRLAAEDINIVGWEIRRAATHTKYETTVHRIKNARSKYNA